MNVKPGVQFGLKSLGRITDFSLSLISAPQSLRVVMSILCEVRSKPLVFFSITICVPKLF